MKRNEIELHHYDHHGYHHRWLWSPWKNVKQEPGPNMVICNGSFPNGGVWVHVTMISSADFSDNHVMMIHNRMAWLYRRKIICCYFKLSLVSGSGNMFHVHLMMNVVLSFCCGRVTFVSATNDDDDDDDGRVGEKMRIKRLRFSPLLPLEDIVAQVSE